MNIQKSYDMQEQRGSLYLVATPIGNLEDMTFRAIRILKEVDWIAAEDTRQTRKLCAHYNISTRLISYHEHNKQSSGPELVRIMKSGESIALVSDAGLPAISDPGADLVQQAVEADLSVIPIPGANAALSALIVSGLSTERFIFVGFLPKEKNKRNEMLDQYKWIKETLLFYESPHRLMKTLLAMKEVWGDRSIVVARELTKRFEEVIRGTISQCEAYIQEHAPRGEYCIVAEGSMNDMEDGLNDWWKELSIEEHYETYLQQKLDRKDAMKKVALDRKVSKREIYNQLI